MRKWPTLVLVSTWGLFVPSISPAQGQITQRIVMLENREAPGGGEFDAPDEPVIGQGGHIGFRCSIAGKGKAIFVGKPGNLKRVVMVGDAVPGGADGMTFKLGHLQLWLDESGDPTFLTDANWPDHPEGMAQLKWPRVLVSTGSNAELVSLAIQGMPMAKAPPAFKTDRIDAFSAGGWAIWRTNPFRYENMPPNDSAVMAAKAGNIVLLISEGIQVNGVPDPRARLNDVAGGDLGVAGNGFTVQKASLGDTEEGGTSNLLIGMMPGKPHGVLVRSGIHSPAPGWHFNNFNHPRPDDSGGVLFRAEVVKSGAREKLAGFFHRDPGGAFRTVLKGGDPVPGAGGLKFKEKMGSAEGWLSPKNGYALVTAEIEGAERGKDRGYWLWSASSGKLFPVVIIGEAAGGLGSGARIKKVKQIVVNSSGQVAVHAEVEGGSGRSAIWAGKPGALQLVAAEGEVVELGADSYEVGGLRFSGGRIEGQRAALNKDGQLVYAVDLKDHGRAIVLAEIGK